MSLPEEEPLPQKEERIRYRTMKQGLYADDIPLDAYRSLVHGWHQYDNGKRGRVVRVQFKFNRNPER